jgi:prepilin-type N-terminal cleavage/methylation domain-containing protein
MLPAFSLIELMVVVTLVAILAVSISINLHGAQDDHALQMAAEDLASAIRFAYEESRIKSIAHRVSFADRGTSYRIESATGDQNQPYRPVVGVAGVYRHLASGIHIKTIKPSFGGQMDSTCEELPCVSPGGFDGEITLSNRRGDTIKIEILAGTGQVYVEG